MQIAILAVLLAIVLCASGSPLVFNVSQSGSIMPGSSITYTLQNTLESDGTPTAFYVLLDGNENCTIQSTTANSNPAFDGGWATNATFPSNSAVFFYTPPPTSAASLNWTITLMGIQNGCGYSIQARNMPALPIAFGQTYTFENTEPFGYVRFSTAPKDLGKPFPAVMVAIGVSTGGNPDFPGCEANAMTDPSIGFNGEDWYITDRSISYDAQWGIYSSTPNVFIQAVSGFFPSAAVPVSFYARTSWNNSVPCPKWNVTLNPIPATPLKVGQSLALSYTSGGPFDPAIIFGPSGSQSYSLVLKYVSGNDCPIGYAGNDPSTFTGQGNFQVSGSSHLNATNPTLTVPVSGANAANYIWTAYLDSTFDNCQITASFQ